jgi:hypothetical protein
MKRKDILFIVLVIAIIGFLFIWKPALEAYTSFNKNHGLVSSFIKFGVLATLGEMIGLRIRTGNYYRKTFGVLPKAIIWGFIGLTIKMAFVIFSSGTPQFLQYLGFTDAMASMNTSFSGSKLFVAFAISTAMNVIYAPVMMTFHKITDMHIAQYNGKLTSLVKPIDFSSNFKNIDWKVQWNFVFKKTIPIFWIPAHTLTFLLPPDFQVLFAALLSLVLGLILAIASLKSKN